MGYGGNLIWTSAFKALAQTDGKTIAPVHLPLLSDILLGRLYDGSISLRNDIVFRHNPRLAFPDRIAKSWIAKIADTGFRQLLRLPHARRTYEEFVFRQSERFALRGSLRYVHIDMRIHSYAERVERTRIIWKNCNRAADAVLSRFISKPAALECELYFTEAERVANARLIEESGLHSGFVVIEPSTNQDYFGELRSWPPERWGSLLQRIRRHFPKLKIVQTGLPRGEPLPGVIDLRGKTDFRGAALLLGSAWLFIGTEGGLMHAANAVGATALILWGGVTLPEFAGYPTKQRTICKYVTCAPCGRRGTCNAKHICMRHIEVEEVEAAVVEMLQSKAGI